MPPYAHHCLPQRIQAAATRHANLAHSFPFFGWRGPRWMEEIAARLMI
jgi:hypothetical protein